MYFCWRSQIVTIVRYNIINIRSDVSLFFLKTARLYSSFLFFLLFLKFPTSLLSPHLWVFNKKYKTFTTVTISQSAMMDTSFLFPSFSITTCVVPTFIYLYIFFESLFFPYPYNHRPQLNFLFYVLLTNIYLPSRSLLFSFWSGKKCSAIRFSWKLPF